MATLNGQQQLNLLVLFTAGLLFWSGLASMLPTLPLYVRDAGGSSQQVGIVMACFAVGLLLSKAWLSRLADEQGRKLVLVIGMSAIALAPLGYLAFQSIPILMALRGFHGISIAAFATAYSALVIDISPPQNRGEVIGYMSLVNPIGLALGPALGGFLQETGGYTPAFLSATALGVLGLICTARVQESPIASAGGAARPETDQKFWSLLGSERVRVPAFVLLMVGIAFGTISTFAPLFITSVGVDLNIGLFYTAAAIASFSVRILIGRASDRYGRGLFITLSLILYSGAMLILCQATTAALFVLGAIFQGAAGGTIIPMTAALMADRSYPNERGRMFGLCMVGFDAGIAAAGPIMGSFADSVGFRLIFGCVAGLILIGLAAFLTLSSKDMAHSLRFALGRGQDLYAVD
ncbi:MAG: MFS transporter [Synechococcales bacterium]|nr:MFS transporter [Synechococcales bacterium]